jgi:NAD(P)-dependent dehydrogenase (short-subunit alcohol dehydrogenase family)
VFSSDLKAAKRVSVDLRSVGLTAAAVAFLCSEEAKFITGQTLGVNGGAVM